MIRLSRLAAAALVALTATAVAAPAANAVSVRPTPVVTPRAYAKPVPVASLSTNNAVVTVTAKGLTDAEAARAATEIATAVAPLHVEDATTTYTAGTLKYQAYLLSPAASNQVKLAVYKLKRAHRWWGVTASPVKGTSFTMTAPNHAGYRTDVAAQLQARLPRLVGNRPVTVTSATMRAVVLRYNSKALTQAQLNSVRAEVAAILKANVNDVRVTR